MAKRFANPDVSMAQLQELLRYDPSTGFLHWKKRRNQVAVAGAVAGSKQSHRGKTYVRVRIGRHLIMAHHIVWALHHGSWAEDQIDHINGEGLDNRLENLRSVPQSENNRNAAIRKDNKTGVSGVTFSRNGTYIAHIRYDGKFKRLGTFKTLDEAAEARRIAMKMYGFHENHGRHKTLRDLVK